MERASLAREIIHTCLEMTRLGLNQGTAGNVSVRYRPGISKQKVFIITNRISLDEKYLVSLINTTLLIWK